MTGRPKPCQICGVRPPAMREIPCCFDCWPGGPVTPPPCRKCGSTKDYFTSGLCARCHTQAPGALSSAWRASVMAGRGLVVDSCPDCHAWGTTRTFQWVCAGCRAWRAKYPTSQCGNCGRRLAVNGIGGCRLCVRQRRLALAALTSRSRRPGLVETNRHGQQLFLADTFCRRGMHTPQRRSGGQAPLLPVIRPVDHRQLLLADPPRDLVAGRRRTFPPPPDPLLDAALRAHIDEHGLQHGWDTSTVQAVQRAVRILLGTQDTPGAAIHATDVTRLSAIESPVRPTLEALAAAGMLVDDRRPALLRWADSQIADLPEQIREELGLWIEVMRSGNPTPPRRRPRSENTLRSQLSFALPAIRAWASSHASLREITRDEVLAALPPAGRPRSTMLQGLRSIFGVLKARRLVFTNPTSRISVPTPHRAAPAAIDLTAVRDAVNSDKPVTAALAALLAFHAVRPGQLRALHTTDLRDGRLHLGDQVIPLAEPVRQRLSAWLDHRGQTWPNTRNPHLFIHYRNATTTTPVQTQWIARQLGMSPQSIRLDRILDEVHATSGDIRAISDLFGLSIAGAYRVATSMAGTGTAPLT